MYECQQMVCGCSDTISKCMHHVLPPTTSPALRCRSHATCRMLAPRELEKMFNTYASCRQSSAGSAAATEVGELVLSYEQFLAVIVHVGQIIRTVQNLCLSESTRWAC